MGKNKKRVKISKNPDGSVMQFSREPNVPLHIKGFKDDALKEEARTLGKACIDAINRGESPLADLPTQNIGQIRARLRLTFPGETWMDEGVK